MNGLVRIIVFVDTSNKNIDIKTAVHIRTE